jgi:phosphatidylglycerol---prolipoprotein diacylglyceryl transferase
MVGAIPYRTFPQLGPFHTFGLLVALGVLFGVYMMAVHMERVGGVDRDTIYRFAVPVLVVAFVGARLTWVITNFRDIHSPLDVIAVWKGGLQFAGGFIGGTVMVVRWLRQHPDVHRWRFLDSVALSVTGGLAVGRIGCYSVGEHLGKSTSFLLGVKYLGGATREGTVNGVPFAGPNGGPPLAAGEVIHNTALYEFGHLVVLLGVLLLLRHRAKVRDGTLFVVFLVWYAVGRFLTDFLRAYDRTKFGLTGAQWLSLLMFVGAVAVSERLYFHLTPWGARPLDGETVLDLSSPSMDDAPLAQERVSAPQVVLGADWEESSEERD